MSPAATAATPPAAMPPASTPRAPESVPSAPASSPSVSPADVISPVMAAVAAATSAAPAAIPVPGPALAARQATPTAPRRHAHRSLRARDSRGAPAVAAGPAEITPSLASTTPQAEPVGDRVERSRTPDRTAGGISGPQRLPQQSPVPRPDAGAPGTSGGGGSAPLLPLIGALAAGFALFGFRVHRRRLPRTAFLKPRRLVLAVWHPG
jgi:hypothetical protein